jgi:starch synthase
MNIVIAAGEAFPFCKTGGLADVVGALTQDLSRVQGAKVLLFLPHYRGIKNAPSLRSVPGVFWIPIGTRIEPARISYLKWGAALAFFIDSPRYFDRQELYYTASGDYSDNDERFIFYSRAVLEACKFIGFRPDIIHAHDWQAGLIPAYLQTVYKTDSFFTKTRSAFTLHNVAYQGYFGKDSFEKANFFSADYNPDKFEYYGGISYLKSAIVFADKVNTVSPQYAKELLSGINSFAMEGVLLGKGGDFSGILNGIDYSVWDPENDTLIPMGYDCRSARGKEICKASLRRELGLTEDPYMPLLAVVSRLVYQKGVDLIAQAIPRLIGKAQFVIQGKGDAASQKAFFDLAAAYPGKVAYRAELEESLAHKIYAASDLFLMPSRFEPCGLGQMIAMRYGALPLVSKTGGLLDTVTDFFKDPASATGFFIDELTPSGLKAAVDKALNVLSDKTALSVMFKNAMSKDFSWRQSSDKYLEMFSEMMKKGAKWQ